VTDKRDPCWSLFFVSLLLPMRLPASTSRPLRPRSRATTWSRSTPLKRKNPIKPTAESLARGRRQYGYDCSLCHGKDGDGKGDVAIDMKLKMHDYTEPATLRDRTDSERFYIINNGRDQMPPEGDRVKAEEVWDLVNYIRAFARKKAAAEEKTPN
jgi:mono/diheme cytochrome c family protein